MTSWIIVVGGTPQLAALEFRALFPSFSLVPLSASCFLLEHGEDFSPEAVRDIAGGVVKIARLTRTVPQPSAVSLASILVENNPEVQKIVFGISRYDGKTVTLSFLADIKRELEKLGKHTRFIEAKHGTLSSVVVAKQGVQELVVAKKGDQWVVGQTVVVQDFEGWNRRDYGRPYADPKAGMLPPKIARMAVNIAIGPRVHQTILDPFCGMGTILAEGLLRNCRVIGSDQSQQVVEKAQANLQWLARQAAIDAKNFQLFVSDATHISEQIPPASVDAIVTEPFMGTTRLGGNEQAGVSDDTLRNTVKGLEKLYIGCLKDWAKVLKPHGMIVMALPKYIRNGKTYFVKKVVDSCENLGYTTLDGPIEYGRPQAIVKREFYIFQKNNYGTR